MRFEKIPDNQLNINFESQVPNSSETKQQEIDKIVQAISADCEVAKKKMNSSPTFITSLKKLKELAEARQPIPKSKNLNEEAEKMMTDYYKKVYLPSAQEQKKEVSNLGEKSKKENEGTVDYKRMQYKDNDNDDEN